MAALTLELAKNTPARAEGECLKPFTQENIKKVRAFHKSMWGYYHPTPLVELPGLATWLGVKNIYVKDEAARFGLQSFKALGASYAMGCYLAQKMGLPIERAGFDFLASEEVKSELGQLTFATASTGNHGRGLAWMSRLLGFAAVVYMPQGSAPERVAAIKREGATVKITNVNYDETVKLLARDAEANKWVLIQDTALPGYADVPLWIMQGYTTMAAEALDALPAVPTHVFVQAGVGSMAAAVQAAFATSGGQKALFTILEPATANCFYRSFISGTPCNVTGDLATIMSGLACGECNPLAWTILKNYSSFCFSCKEEVAALGMRLWGNPLTGDPKLVAGPAGAIGGGVLGLLEKFHNLKTDLGLNKDSVLLLFNTEGDILADAYRDIVWGGSFPIDYRRKF
ncbi:MAG: diaminopropionate ammonia-lyase [Acidaminococcaceae bacterium]